MNAVVEIDVRRLDPPEPMERALDALSALKDGQTLVMLIDREPRPFFRILERNGYGYQVQITPEHEYRIEIRKQTTG